MCARLQIQSLISGYLDTLANECVRPSLLFSNLYTSSLPRPHMPRLETLEMVSTFLKSMKELEKGLNLCRSILLEFFADMPMLPLYLLIKTWQTGGAKKLMFFPFTFCYFVSPFFRFWHLLVICRNLVGRSQSRQVLPDLIYWFPLNQDLGGPAKGQCVFH